MQTTQTDLKTLIERLTIIHRKREDYMKSRIIVGNQVKAITRRMKKREFSEAEINEHIQPIINGTSAFDSMENFYTKEMTKLAKELPIHDWFCKFDGCSSMGLAMLIAEIGNLSDYENPAKVWKRMGLAVRNGSAEKNTEKGVQVGYSVRRRMIAYRISSSIVKKDGYYRNVYDKRKEYEIERDSLLGNIDFIRERKVKMLAQFQSSENKKLIQNNQLPKSVIDLRAQRYMVKRLLRDMWMEWNKNI